MMRSRVLPVLLLSAALLAGCDGDRPRTDPAGTAGPPAPPITVADPPLDRQAIILAVARAASDWAAGRADLEAQRRLDGKTFQLKLRLYCPGDDRASRRWSFDEQERVLRLEVEPEISVETPLLRSLGLEGFEAAEGFWLHREWLFEAVCPAPRRAPAQEAEAQLDEPEEAAEGDEPGGPAETGGARLARAAPVIGIAQFYTDQDPRTSRRETRAYQTTLKLAESQEAVSQVYDLVLSGRLSGLPDGRVIACTGTPEVRPSCIVSARFDHVALTDPHGQVLAQWSGG